MSRFRKGYEAHGYDWSLVSDYDRHGSFLSVSGILRAAETPAFLLAVEAAVEVCPWQAAKEAYVDAQLAGGSEEAAWDAAIAAYNAAKGER